MDEPLSRALGDSFEPRLRIRSCPMGGLPWESGIEEDRVAGRGFPSREQGGVEDIAMVGGGVFCFWGGVWLWDGMWVCWFCFFWF